MAPNPINVAFGKALALRRGELDLTQAELAGLVGMSRASIANIEKGRQNVLLHHIYDLAAALRMPKVGDTTGAPETGGEWPTPSYDLWGSASARNVAQASDLVANALASIEGRRTGS